MFFEPENNVTINVLSKCSESVRIAIELLPSKLDLTILFCSQKIDNVVLSIGSHLQDFT